MAALPLTRHTRALTIVLALSVVMLVSPPIPAHLIAPASATEGTWAFEEPAPPPSPDPVPGVDGPADPGQLPAKPAPHRRHIDGDPNITR
jgi:hypothetical protein